MNEFKVKNGLIVNGTASFTGNITAPNLIGTSSWASNATSASHALVSDYVTNVPTIASASWASSSISASHALESNTSISASNAISASYALTASFAINASAGQSVSSSWASSSLSSSYPWTALPDTTHNGNVNIIDGNLKVSGSLFVSASNLIVFDITGSSAIPEKGIILSNPFKGLNTYSTPLGFSAFRNSIEAQGRLSMFVQNNGSYLNNMHKALVWQTRNDLNEWTSSCLFWEDYVDLNSICELRGFKSLRLSSNLNTGIHVTTFQDLNILSSSYINLRQLFSSKGFAFFNQNNPASAGLFISASGFVGIGTTTPQTKLHVRGTVSASLFSAPNNSTQELTSSWSNNSLSASVLVPYNIMVTHANGTFTYYRTTNDSLNRGNLLLSASNASVAGDTIYVFNSGVYVVSSSIQLPTSVSMVGLGQPQLVGSTLTQPLIHLTSSAVTIDGFYIRSNTSAIGFYSTAALSASNQTIKNIIAEPNHNEANGAAYLNNHAGGATQHLLTNIWYDNCKLFGGEIAGYGLRLNAFSGSTITVKNCDTFGYTDAILFGGSPNATANVIGGNHQSITDGITSGGPLVYVNGGKVRSGNQNGDLFEDGGTIVAHGVDYVLQSDYVSGDFRVPKNLIAGHSITSSYASKDGTMGITSTMPFGTGSIVIKNGLITGFIS